MPYDTNEPQTSARPDFRDLLIIALLMEIETLMSLIEMSTDRLIRDLA